MLQKVNQDTSCRPNQEAFLLVSAGSALGGGGGGGAGSGSRGERNPPPPSSGETGVRPHQAEAAAGRPPPAAALGKLPPPRTGDRHGALAGRRAPYAAGGPAGAAGLSTARRRRFSGDAATLAPAGPRSPAAARTAGPARDPVPVPPPPGSGFRGTGAGLRRARRAAGLRGHRAGAATAAPTPRPGTGRSARPRPRPGGRRLAATLPSQVTSYISDTFAILAAARVTRRRDGPGRHWQAGRAGPRGGARLPRRPPAQGRRGRRGAPAAGEAWLGCRVKTRREPEPEAALRAAG